MKEKLLKMLMDNLSEIDLTEKEEGTINWLAGWDMYTVENICSIIKKCKEVKIHEVTKSEKSVQDIVEKQLKELYPNGLPDNLVVSKQRTIGQTSRESWLAYLIEKGFTEETYKALDGYKQYQLHCSYCNKYNIPHIED